MKKWIAMLMALWLLTVPVWALERPAEGDLSLSAPAALLMEKSSGTIIYEKNAYAPYSPASVTKVMTMLLVIEAIENGSLSYDTPVTASARAASMGGSQIWLEEGEQMSAEEMLKCVAVVSANDCAVALAEHLAGSEEAFVRRMNERAAELGMEHSHFTNCTGLLESDEHYSCANDIALMSRALLMHEDIKRFTTIWMDTARGGAFGLSNTNRLIFSYDGATGLKTGFTSKAMYCLSASAERDGVEYIAVVLHAPSSKERFADCQNLLNYAFANYELISLRPEQALPPIPVKLGTADCVQPVWDGAESLLVNKGGAAGAEYRLELCEELTAPVLEGQPLGTLTVAVEDRELACIPLRAERAVERLSFGQVFGRLVGALLGLDLG